MNPDGVMIYLTGHATLAGCQLAQQARLTENRTSGSIAAPTGLREQPWTLRFGVMVPVPLPLPAM